MPAIAFLCTALPNNRVSHPIRHSKVYDKVKRCIACDIVRNGEKFTTYIRHIFQKYDPGIYGDVKRIIDFQNKTRNSAGINSIRFNYSLQLLPCSNKYY